MCAQGEHILQIYHPQLRTFFKFSTVSNKNVLRDYRGGGILLSLVTYEVRVLGGNTLSYLKRFVVFAGMLY
jgi:hypothetical protein